MLIGKVGRMYCPLISDEEFPEKLRLLQSTDLKSDSGEGTPRKALQRALFEAIVRHAIVEFQQSQPHMATPYVHVKQVSTIPISCIFWPYYVVAVTRDCQVIFITIIVYFISRFTHTFGSSTNNSTVIGGGTN